VLGIPAGLIWAAVAPRALLEEVSKGVAQVMNAETSAFIAGDAWFCIVCGVAGLLSGVVGYLLLVRRRGSGYGALAATGLILGGLAAALIAQWIGQHSGSSGYQQNLADAATGTRFSASLSLGSKSALAFWPMLTAIIITLIESGRRGPAPQPVREDLLFLRTGRCSTDQ
jgi:hypothetical protein